ncbi:MAG TPA: Hsp70 family protein, partial [Planctomycetia bacterium]|nr:Hsp70 family protein [Planctomycetia bacterium]
MAAQPYVGIDLGTTNSVVAHVDSHGRPVALANSEGDLLTPSVVYFETEGPAIIGREAIKAGLVDPANCIEAVKRDMGKEFCHKQVRGKKMPPAAISGVILHRLVKDAAARTGPIERAVVTVPAYFNEPRRRSTVDAGRMSGLKEIELLNEPTAAALAFGFELGAFTEDGKLATKETKVPGQYTLLVYDLGGGTFDVTLMRIKDQHFQALVCDGDVQLGGRDWDQRILDYVCDCFINEYSVDPRTDARAMAEFRLQAEEIKRTLSVRQKSLLRLQFGEHKLSIELAREDLLALTADLLQRTRMTCELALMDAKTTWDKVDAVLLVGGASRMPMVRELLRELSGMEPNHTVSPDQAVAQGAALYAQILWGEGEKLKDEVAAPRKKVRITNVNSHSLGIVGRDRKTNARRVSVLIPKNTPIPQTNRKTFRTRVAGQDKIYIQIVEGESSNPDECTVIGECRLVDLPELPANHPVQVAFAYRRDGRIFVEAEVEGHQPFQVEIDRNRKIAAAEMENWASELIGDEDE